MDLDASKHCCAPKSRRSGSGLGVVAGVGALALCCALPALLASGALAAVAGRSVGVWAAIFVVVLSVAVWWFRRRHRPIDRANTYADSAVHGAGALRRTAPAERVE